MWHPEIDKIYNPFLVDMSTFCKCKKLIENEWKEKLRLLLLKLGNYIMTKNQKVWPPWGLLSLPEKKNYSPALSLSYNPQNSMKEIPTSSHLLPCTQLLPNHNQFCWESKMEIEKRKSNFIARLKMNHTRRKIFPMRVSPFTTEHLLCALKIQFSEWSSYTSPIYLSN